MSYLQNNAEAFVFPASSEQIRYWLLNRLAEDSTANNMVISVRADGSLNDTLVERAIHALVERHESLRTTLDLVDGELSQIISEEPVFGFTVISLDEGTAEARDAQALELIRQHGASIIDLTHGPVILAQLIHVGPQRHYLTFNLHYSVCDGWSNGVLISDFAELYTALVENRPAQLPVLEFQFADFTVWQQEWLESEEAARAIQFWKRQAQLQMPVLDIPIDSVRSADTNVPGAIEKQSIDREFEAVLKNYARTRGTTLHIVLQTACEALLTRITGQDRYLLGSTIANRTKSGMDHLVGRYANPQVIVADVSGNPTFRELLDRVASWNIESYTYQDLPFSKVIEEFQRESRSEGSQFLPVFFVYQRAFMRTQTSSAITLTPIPSASVGVSYDLLLTPVEDDDGMQIEVEYNTRLFTQRRVRHLIEQYLHLLQAVVEDDELRVLEIPLQTVTAVTSVSPSALPSKTLVELIEQQSSRRREEVVVVEDGRSFRWSELVDRVRVCSAALHSRGLVAGDSVAIGLQPSFDTVAVCLAAIRCGLIVLPVSSQVSLDQWAQLIHDAEPALGVPPQELAMHLARSVSVQELLAGGGNEGSIEFEVTPEGSAWAGLSISEAGTIRTTSVSHALCVQQLEAAARSLGLREGDAVVSFAAPGSVDAFIDILLPLVSGCRLVLAKQVSGEGLQALLDREQIHAMLATDEQCTTLAASGWSGDKRLHLICHDLRTAADHLEMLAQRVRKITAFFTAAEVGGPFAAAPVATLSYLTPVLPLDGQQLVVVDTRGAAVEPGVLGMLALRTPIGEQLSPWMARASHDTGFELMDMASRVVEHKGMRIALRDLEAAITPHSAVAMAAAYLSASSDGGAAELRLAITLRPNQTATALALKQYLAERIAPYLRPDRILITSALPRRVDGTIDYTRVISTQEMTETIAYVGPRDEVEQKLVDIWEQVLNRRSIGVEDNFFSFGGYSLTIVRLFARINKTFKSSLPITTIFNAPSIAQLADLIRGHHVYSALVPVQTEGAKPPLFMLHSYLLYGSLPIALGSDQPFYGLRETEQDGLLDVKQRVAHYISEIRTVQPHGPYYLAGWCAAGPITVEMAHQLTQAGEEVALTLLFDAWHPDYPDELAKTNRAARTSFREHPFFEKVRFHQTAMNGMPLRERLSYLRALFLWRLRQTKHDLLVSNWELAHKLSNRFGWQLPDFMQNVTYGTYASANLHQGNSIPGRITLIRAQGSDNLANAIEDCGWSRLTESGVDVSWAPGDHETMFIDSNLSITAELVRRHIAQARAALSASAEQAPSPSVAKE